MTQTNQNKEDKESPHEEWEPCDCPCHSTSYKHTEMLVCCKRYNKPYPSQKQSSEWEEQVKVNYPVYREDVGSHIGEGFMYMGDVKKFLSQHLTAIAQEIEVMANEDWLDPNHKIGMEYCLSIIKHHIKELDKGSHNE